MPASTAYPEVVICMPDVLLDGEELQPCISGSQAPLVPSKHAGKCRSGIEVDAEG